jgi:DNA-binding transcriptional LysR family regulator
LASKRLPVASLKTGREEIAGVLHVATSVGFGRTHVMSRMRTFMRRYALLRIDVQLNDRFVDLVEEGIDVAFRIGELKVSGLIARRIGGFAPQWAPQQRVVRDSALSDRSAARRALGHSLP